MTLNTCGRQMQVHEPLIGYQVTSKASDWLLTGRDIKEESKEESGGKECSRETGNCLRCSIRDNDAMGCNKSRADARCWPDTVSWPLIGHRPTVPPSHWPMMTEEYQLLQ